MNVKPFIVGQSITYLAILKFEPQRAKPDNRKCSLKPKPKQGIPVLENQIGVNRNTKIIFTNSFREHGPLAPLDPPCRTATQFIIYSTHPSPTTRICSWPVTTLNLI